MHMTSKHLLQGAAGRGALALVGLLLAASAALAQPIPSATISPNPLQPFVNEDFSFTVDVENSAALGSGFNGFNVELELIVPGGITLEDIAPDGRVLISFDNERLAMESVGATPEEARDLTWFDWTIAKDITPDHKSVLFDRPHLRRAFPVHFCPSAPVRVRTMLRRPANNKNTCSPNSFMNDRETRRYQKLGA